ncbi:glutamate racemase [Campylobacter novaezeelandiae]|uniref:Glutamate racemase n=1 Tax=Campylobacter novaezeelandiae TaxID=2267891 RepID=A0A4Q9JVY4_9BACT|nr:glutamate racemase [Campylobacter novaezeelandiae]TBR82368.1 glutamate racemase [Campylobacter novaezeelandiae]
MKIGVFDSGIGGLSVLKSLYNSKLFEKIIYYGDTARVPYGTKDKDTIIKFCLEALEFFKQHKVDFLVIACNTASAYALDALRQNCSFPIFGVIEAGINETKKQIKDKNKKILVIATKATIDSKEYQKRLTLEGFTQIQALATGLFVPLVEEGIFEREVLNSVFNYYFKDIQNPDALILACTHFPFLSNPLENYFENNIKLIHSGDSMVEFLKNHYTLKIYKETKIEFYASSNVDYLKFIAKKWLNF